MTQRERQWDMIVSGPRSISIPSGLINVARRVRDAGGLQTFAEFEAFAAEYEQIPGNSNAARLPLLTALVGEYTPTTARS